MNKMFVVFEKNEDKTVWLAYLLVCWDFYNNHLKEWCGKTENIKWVAVFWVKNAFYSDP